jgi:ketosteroid isomerase-like protein
VRRSPEVSPPTSEEKLALVERAYYWLQAIRDDEPGALEDAFRDCLDEKLEVCIPDDYPEGGQTFRGRKGLQRWTDTTKEIWEEWRFERERLLDAGDRVVVLIRVLARGGSSGVSLDRRTAHIWTVEDRRVTRCEVFLDRSEALAAAGLQDQVDLDV